MDSIEKINRLTQDATMTKVQFDRLFDAMSNRATGNCLFESFAQHFLKDYRYPPLPRDVKSLADDLRKSVCNFYKKFDAEREYPEDSIDQKIAFAIIADTLETSGVSHAKNICKNEEYANVADMCVICKLKDCNLVLFNRDERGKEQKYSVLPIRNAARFPTYHIRHIDENHYEACIPKKLHREIDQVAKKPSPKRSATEKKRPSPNSKHDIPADFKYKLQLSVLENMGYNNKVINMEALNANNGHCFKAAEYIDAHAKKPSPKRSITEKKPSPKHSITEKKPSPKHSVTEKKRPSPKKDSSQSNNDEETFRKLKEMGYTNDRSIKTAVRIYNGNMEKIIAYLEYDRDSD